MMRVVKTLGFMALVAMVACSAQALVVTYQHGIDGVTSDDARLYNLNPDTNYQLSYMPAENITARFQNGLISFAGVTTPVGQTFVSAVLRLYSFGTTFGYSDPDFSGDVTVDVSALLVPFDAAVVTPNSNTASTAWSGFMAQGVADSTVVSSLSTGPTEGYVEFDVTTLYASGLANGWLTSTAIVDDGAQLFRDSNAGVAGQEAQLVVTYIPEPATLSLLGIGMLLMVLRRRAR